jgi:hypothetical protein
LSRSIIININININIIMSVEAKKVSIRAALQELSNPTFPLQTYFAIEKLHQTVVHDFEEIFEPIGDFVGDDDFKEEIFSARVIQVLIAVARDKAEYPTFFYHYVCTTLQLLCLDSTERSTAFVAHGGVEFLLEALEAFSPNEFLLIPCFGLHWAVIQSLGKYGSASFGEMTLGKLLDVFKLHAETADEVFYIHYCLSVGSCFRPGLILNENENLFQRTVAYVWFGITKYKYAEDAQNTGRSLLCHLAGDEYAIQMIDYSEMTHISGEECARCA